MIHGSAFKPFDKDNAPDRKAVEGIVMKKDENGYNKITVDFLKELCKANGQYE